MSQTTDPTPAQMYEAYYGPAIFEPCTEVLLSHAAPRPGEVVLDLACGTGRVARRVAPLVGEHGRVVAVDLNPGMLAVARSLPAPPGAAIDWRAGDAVTLDLGNGAFDLVLCQQGVQFFTDRAGALQHMHRVLKPGGRMVLATWCDVSRHQLFGEFAEVEAPRLGPLGVSVDELFAPFSLGDAGELRALLEGAGFAPDSIEITERSIEARFPSPETFVYQMEFAYGAVIPAFAENRAAFIEFVDAVTAETAELVQRHTRDGHVCFPMYLHVTSAVKG